MSDQRVGTCSLCGGSVVGFRGTWMSIFPPPPDRCTSCGAVSATDIIDMVPGTGKRFITETKTSTTTDITLDSLRKK